MSSFLNSQRANKKGAYLKLDHLPADESQNQREEQMRFLLLASLFSSALLLAQTNVSPTLGPIKISVTPSSRIGNSTSDYIDVRGSYRWEHSDGNRVGIFSEQMNNGSGIAQTPISTNLMVDFFLQGADAVGVTSLVLFKLQPNMQNIAVVSSTAGPGYIPTSLRVWFSGNNISTGDGDLT